MNITAVRTKFPEHAKMSDAAFLTFMHKEYYSDMDRKQMYAALLKLKGKTVDKGALVKLGHTPQDIAKMPYAKAAEIIEKKIEKPQEEVKAEKQAQILEEVRALSTKTLENIKSLADNKPLVEPPKIDMTMHEKIDTLIKKMETSKPAKQWEFEIVRNERGD